MGKLKDMEDARELTDAEARRKERFERLKDRMAEEGYVASNLTVGIAFANVMAIVIALPVIALFVFLYLQVNSTIDIAFDPTSFIVLLAVFIALVFVHEGLHGLTWGLFAEHHWRDIEFGFIVKMLTPYCTCGEPLRRWQYLLGALMPLIALGIIPSIVAIVTGNSTLLVVGILMTLAAGGDMLIALKVATYRSTKSEVLFLDHPYQGGSVVFER